MRAFRIALIFVSAAASNAFAQNGSTEAAAAAATITTEDVKQRVGFLASDALKGRDTPSPGLEAAAKYVADEFAKFGLKPGGDDGTFIQRWPFGAQKYTGHIRVGSDHHNLKFGSEFFVIPAPTFDSISGSVLLGGAASPMTMANPAFRGKVVAMTIAGDNLDEAWLANARPAVGAAISSGATAVVFLLDSAFTGTTIGHVINNTGGSTAPIPVIGIRNDVARKLLKDGGFVSVRSATSRSNPPNVVGILEGSDPVLRDTYIVYSAHMDHIGVGVANSKGDSIYNGADDDASGVSAVIEVAQAFAAMKQRPKRSIIFLTVSGEEKGLYGSAWFNDHPPVPSNQMIADINIDMIGRNSPDTTVAIGQEYSSLGASAQAAAKQHPELRLVVAPDLWPHEALFFRSDHYNFALHKIPAIFFTSGLHADYHQLSDEPATIDNDKLARTAKLVFWLGYDLANNPKAPEWTAEGLSAIKDAH